MCVSPIKLADGKLVSCHKCWQCTENRIRDWCGRCIAESRTAKAASFVTLTYGRVDDNPDHVRAAVLTYSDVQKYFKRLRKAGYPCRYVVAGEYGERKGRTHWHAIIFWIEQVPPHTKRKRFLGHSMWEHGHTFWDDVHYKTVRYVCKYLLKAEDGSQSMFKMSKQPPIGAHYFKQLALKYVSQGLAPKSIEYSFPEVRDPKGQKIIFQMSGATLDHFCGAYVRAWAIDGPSKFHPHSEVLDEYYDRVTRSEGIFPLVHKTTIHEERYQTVTWDEQGVGTWHERKRLITEKQRFLRDRPGEPLPPEFK